MKKEGKNEGMFCKMIILIIILHYKFFSFLPLTFHLCPSINKSTSKTVFCILTLNVPFLGVAWDLIPQYRYHSTNSRSYFKFWGLYVKTIEGNRAYVVRMNIFVQRLTESKGKKIKASTEAMTTKENNTINIPAHRRRKNLPANRALGLWCRKL